MKRMIVAAACCFLLVVLLGWWFWRAKPDPLRGATYRKDGLFAGYVHLAVTQFIPQENVLAGTASVSLGAENEAGYKDALQYEGLESLWFRIENADKSSVLGIVGETQKPMPIAGLGLRTEGAFRWEIKPIHGALFYPFDAYVAQMHPVLNGERAKEPGAWLNIPVETVSADFSGVNFTTAYTHGSEESDWFTLQLTRPLWLRVITVVTVLLLIVWAVSFPLSTKVEPAGLLTLFVGIFGLRSSLLSGAPVFPCLIDYLSILLYLYVVAMLLLRRTYARPERECPYCRSRVHPQATVCAACTRLIESGDKQASIAGD